MKKKKRILVTGSTGFIGQAQIRHLDDLGYQVDTLDRVPQPANDQNHRAKSYIWSDLAQIDLSKYTAVIHLAGKAHDTSKQDEQAAYDAVNFGLTKAVFDAWLSSGCGLFALISSILAVSPEGGAALSEQSAGEPGNVYGRSKRKAEEYLLRQMPADRMVYLLRPALVYGDGLKGNLDNLRRLIRTGLPLPLGAIKTRRSYLYLENLVRVVSELVSKHPPSGIYHVADDEAVPLGELIEMLGETVARKVINFPIPKSLLKLLAKTGDYIRLPYNSTVHSKLTLDLVVNNTKLKKALGWEKMPFSFSQGIKTINRG